MEILQPNKTKCQLDGVKYKMIFTFFLAQLLLLPFMGNAQDPSEEKTVVSINVDGVAAEIPQYGKLTGEIVATYNDGSTETVDASKANYVVPIYLGNKDIEITYKSVKATKKVNVVADANLKEVRLGSLPNKLPLNADLSKYSVRIFVYYKDDHEGSFYLPLSELRFLGFDTKKLGKQQAFVDLDGQIHPFAVEIFSVPESLDLANLPTTVEQFTRSLSNDTKVIAKYSDGKTEEITLKACSVSFDASSVGDAVAKVVYNNTEATKTIQVTECPGKPDIINDFYQIANADNLYWVAKYSYFTYSLKAELTADIVVNETVLTADGKLDEKRAGSFKPWIPIANCEEFKGNGHVIKGLYCKRDAFTSFFNTVNKVSGLGLEDFYFEANNSYAFSFAYSVGEMTNCYAIGCLKGEQVYGLSANAFGGNIKDCYAYCTFDVAPGGNVAAICNAYYANGFVNCLANSDLIPGGVSFQPSEFVMPMEKLCDGTLPEGFSDEVWIPGSKSGNTYTFPHLKAFSGNAYSVTLGDYVVTSPLLTDYFIGESIDLANAKYGKKFRGGILAEEAITEADVTGFSTAKAGTFTATITHKGVSTEFTYTVSEAEKIYSFATRVVQNSQLEDIGISLIDKNHVIKTIPFSRAKITGFDVTKLGEQEVTVQIGGLTKTQTIQVSAPDKKAKSIDLSGVNKEAYQYNNQLSGTIKVTFEDGSEEIIDMNTLHFSQFSILGEKKLSISLYGLTEEFTINVVKNPNEPKTIDGVYQISNTDELIWWLRSNFDIYEQIINKTSAVLTADIEINKNVLKADGTLNENPAEPFTLWFNSLRLYGALDGQGHTISGIYSNQQGGLFMDNHGTIKNLGIKDSYFYGGGNSAYLGSFCGINSGKIINCWSTATIDNVYYYSTEEDHGGCGGICYDNSGIIANCHYAGLAKFNLSAEFGAICDNSFSGVVANSYYLASKANADEYARTSDEFADGTVLNLLKNGVAEVANGDIWVQKIGVDKIPSFTEGKEEEQTPVATVDKKSDINVWSYNRTIYIENVPADTKYEIVDLNGRIITTSKTKSTKEEIKINQKGVLIVKIGNNTYKVLI